MKKIISILILISAFLICYYLFYLKSDKKILENFANELVNDSVNTENIISKYVKYTGRGKKTTLYLLNVIKNEYKKNPEKIIVYKKEEERNRRISDQIELKNSEKLYYIKFNKDMIYPFLINEESKIVVLLVLIKGEGGVLSNVRSDE